MLEFLNDVDWLRFSLLSLTYLRFFGTFLSFIPTFALGVNMKRTSYLLNMDTCAPDACFWGTVYDIIFLYFLTLFIPNLLGTVND